MEPTRQLFWNIAGKSIMYSCAWLALVIFIIGFARKIAWWRKGHKSSSPANLRQRFVSLCLAVLTHRNRVFKGKFYRIMHLSIFYGFVVLTLGTLVIALQVDFHVPVWQGNFYLGLSLMLDIFGFAAMIGIVMAAYKRIVKKPDPIDNVLTDAIVLGLVFVILLTGFMLEGLRIYVTADKWAIWTPIGLLISLLVQQIAPSAATARSVHSFLWYLHMLLALGFIAYLPYSKLFHMFATSLSIFLRSTYPQGALVPVELGDRDCRNFGVAKLEDFSRKQLVELDACLSCGRCQKHCPAYLSGAPLSPKELVQTLKRKVKHGQLIDTVIGPKTLWACTSCGLCEVKCPAFLEHVNRIVDMRRQLVNEGNSCPQELQGLFNNLAKEGNPWGLGQNFNRSMRDLPKMAEKRHKEVLYWAGCFGAYEPRNQRVTQAMTNIFAKAGVEFASLGSEQKCCGDAVRRLGNETLFQQLAKENISTLNRYEFKTIVTPCAHCFNTLKNEYPQFGGNYRVMHHSQYILELIKSGRIELKQATASKVTYQDPCYLGRLNNVYDAPRQILGAILGLELVEMKHSRANSSCCGAGGGHIWLEDENKPQGINVRRIEEAAQVEPDILVSACSLCLTNLTGAVSSLKVDMINLDIAEIVNAAL